MAVAERQRIARPGVAARTTPRRLNIGRIAAWAVLILLLVITLFPFWWVLRTGLSNNRSLGTDPGSLLPVDFTLGAFKRVLGLATVGEAQAEGGSGASVNFVRALLNSVIFATVITAGQVFFCAMAAYAFARLRFPGRDKLFFLFLTALMIPPIFITLPNFILIKQLGLLNTYAGMVLPYLFMTPFAIFFLRQFFLGIPRELEEAAMLDGSGRFRTFARVIAPMATPALATLAILTYITAWGDYLWPLLVGSDDKHRVLTVALSVFRSSTPQGSPDWAGLMAATFVAALPMIILFLAFGRRVVNAIQFSGIK
jgi:multiple sugar transport system permease protein